MKFDAKEVVKHTVFALVVGVVGAFTSVILCICVDFCYRQMQAHHWLVFILPAFALLSYALYRAFKLPFDMTTHKVVDYIRADAPTPAALAPGILLATCLSTLGGASVGKEAGALHMGAALGELVSRPFKLKTTRFENAEVKQESQEGLLNQYLDDVAPLADGDPNSMFKEELAIQSAGVKKVEAAAKAAGHMPHDLTQIAEKLVSAPTPRAAVAELREEGRKVSASVAAAMNEPPKAATVGAAAEASSKGQASEDEPSKSPTSEGGPAASPSASAASETSTTDAISPAASAPTDPYAKDIRDRGMRGYPAACGMAATFAALFFSPLGSTMFVLELAGFKMSVRKHIASILLACFVAFFIASAIGIGDIIPKVAIPEPSWQIVGQCIIIGVICAICGLLFVTAMSGIQSWTKRFSQHYAIWLLVGSIATVVLLFAFDWFAYAGSAADLIEVSIKGEQDPLGFIIKIVLTTLALGFWLKGGEIMPTLVAGALLGASCTVFTNGDPGISAAVGMMAFFAAVSRCPVASILMGCEIFGWTAFPYFLIAVVISNAIGRDAGLYGRGAVSAARHMVRDTRQKRKVSEPAS